MLVNLCASLCSLWPKRIYKIPLRRALASVAETPFFDIALSALVVTFILMKRPSSGTQIRLVCRLGNWRRLVWRIECETALPVSGFFPVISQRRAIVVFPTPV